MLTPACYGGIGPDGWEAGSRRSHDDSPSESGIGMKWECGDVQVYQHVRTSGAMVRWRCLVVRVLPMLEAGRTNVTSARM